MTIKPPQPPAENEEERQQQSQLWLLLLLLLLLKALGAPGAPPRAEREAALASSGVAMWRAWRGELCGLRFMLGRRIGTRWLSLLQRATWGCCLLEEPPRTVAGIDVSPTDGHQTKMMKHQHAIPAKSQRQRTPAARPRAST